MVASLVTPPVVVVEVKGPFLGHLGLVNRPSLVSLSGRRGLVRIEPPPLLYRLRRLAAG